MDNKKISKESLNFRDIFMRRRTSIDELNSAENSRRSSLASNEPFKNLMSLMAVSKGVSNNPDQYAK